MNSNEGAATAVEQNGDIVIHRDDQRHAWFMRILGHELEAPWRDTADATSVILWIRGRAGRAVNVKVQL